MKVLPWPAGLGHCVSATAAMHTFIMACGQRDSGVSRQLQYYKEKREEKDRTSPGCTRKNQIAVCVLGLLNCGQ
ncbi:hypothetical protein N7527_008450 [Penicillium freii]|nr:hypothetical protein N7527_008450 [Penicillium freii]